MDIALDLRNYATLPRLDVRSGVALGHAMRTAAPADPHPLVKRELDHTGLTLTTLEDAWRPLAVLAETPERRPADIVLDGAWGAFQSRLAAWARLTAFDGPEPAQASDLLARLFPDGLSFVLLPYDREWAESQRRLDLIDAEGLGPALDALCHPAFLAAVRAAHARYGAVLGITALPPEPAPVPPSLREPFAAFRDALTRYVHKLVGTLDEQDPEAVRAVRAALRPIDDLRAALAARAARPAPADPTPAPVPEA